MAPVREWPNPQIVSTLLAFWPFSSFGVFGLIQPRFDEGFKILAVARLLHLLDGDEAQRGRVNAVAQTRGAGPVVEDVAEVRVGGAGPHLRPLHAEGMVRVFDDIFADQRFGEARPAAAGVEF